MCAEDHWSDAGKKRASELPEDLQFAELNISCQPLANNDKVGHSYNL